MRLRVGCSLLALCCLSACRPAVDPTFGQSYDACVLKNASQGGDDDSRTRAEAICARHFIRPATTEEAKQAKADATITFAPPVIVQPQGKKATNPSGNFYSTYIATPASDVISAQITNSNENVIIRSVQLDAYFHKGPPDGPGGHWSESDPLQHLHWDLDASIDPSATDTVSGTFDGDRAPSRFYKAFAVANMVVPRTDKPVSHLREAP